MQTFLAERTADFGNRGSELHVQHDASSIVVHNGLSSGPVRRFSRARDVPGARPRHSARQLQRQPDDGRLPGTADGLKVIEGVIAHEGVATSAKQLVKGVGRGVTGLGVAGMPADCGAQTSAA
jgi:hypothetical protein